MFFAVHELEAWILSDPRVLPPTVAKALPKSAHQRPETVNFDNPPKSVIKRLYRSKLNRKYRETTDAVKLLDKLDPNLAYQRCPHLRALLDEMLTLAQQQPPEDNL
jgi:hypothetical protein